MGGGVFIAIIFFMDETHHHVRGGGRPGLPLLHGCRHPCTMPPQRPGPRAPSPPDNTPHPPPPHTQFVLKRIRTHEGDLAADSIREAPHIPAPVFNAPWKPLVYLTERAIWPHAVVMFLLVGGGGLPPPRFRSAHGRLPPRGCLPSCARGATLNMPTHRPPPRPPAVLHHVQRPDHPAQRARARPLPPVRGAHRRCAARKQSRASLCCSRARALNALLNARSTRPWHTHARARAVANLPLGLGCFIVGPFGGRWADAGARRWSASPVGRMVPGTVAALILFPLSTLAYAWT